MPACYRDDPDASNEWRRCCEQLQEGDERFNTSERVKYLKRDAFERLLVLMFQAHGTPDFNPQLSLKTCARVGSSTTLLIGGLIHLRSSGDTRNLQVALDLWNRAGKLPSYSSRCAAAVFWAQQATALATAPTLSDITMRLASRLNQNDCRCDSLTLLTVGDVELLLQERSFLVSEAHLAAEDREDTQQRQAINEARQKRMEGSLLGLRDDHSFICGLTYCLQTRAGLDRLRLAEYWKDKYSLIQRYLLGRLNASSRFESPDYAVALENFDYVLHYFDAKEKLKLASDPDRHSEARKLSDQTRLHRSVVYAQIESQQKAQQDARQERELQRALEDERRQMISFLSHTLTSATAGGSNTVRKIASKLASAQANVDLPDVAQRLAAQVSRMARVESLVEVFKLYTSDDKALREGWDRDTGGEFSVLQVCAMAVQQALLRFYFSSEHEVDFSRLMPEANYATVAQEFMTDALALDMSTPDQARQFIDWAEQRLPFLRMSFVGAESAHLAQGGARDIVIFALTGEFLGNALKYAAAGQAITLDISVKPPGLEIVCRNAMKVAAVAPIHGGKTGLTFIRRVCTLINAEFDEPAVKDNVFILRALLPIQ
jgi:hypothetical protein